MREEAVPKGAVDCMEERMFVPLVHRCLPAFILLPRVGVHLCMSGLCLLCLDGSPLFFIMA